MNNKRVKKLFNAFGGGQKHIHLLADDQYPDVASEDI